MLQEGIMIISIKNDKKRMFDIEKGNARSNNKYQKSNIDFSVEVDAKIEFLNGEFKKILNLPKTQEINSKINDIDMTMQIMQQDLLEEFDYLEQQRQAFDMEDNNDDVQDQEHNRISVDNLIESPSPELRIGNL